MHGFSLAVAGNKIRTLCTRTWRPIQTVSFLPRIRAWRPALPPACPTARTSRASSTCRFQSPRPGKSAESALKMRRPCGCGSAAVVRFVWTVPLAGDDAA